MAVCQIFAAHDGLINSIYFVKKKAYPNGQASILYIFSIYQIGVMPQLTCCATTSFYLN